MTSEEIPLKKEYPEAQREAIRESMTVTGRTAWEEKPNLRKKKPHHKPQADIPQPHTLSG